MNNFPNCIAQNTYKPDEVEVVLVSNCCGAPATGTGQDEFCAMCGEGCTVIDEMEEYGE